jgi:ABC-2 type transport system permease protein
MSWEFKSFFTLLWKEILRYLRVATQTVLSPVISSALYMIVFGLSLGSFLQSDSYLRFLIPGLLAMSALNNALQNSASSIIISKFHGDLQDLRVLPLRPITIAIAYALAGWTRAVLCAAAVFGVGQLLLWISGMPFLGIQNVFGLLYFVSVGALFFALIGIWAGFWANSFDQMNVITQFVVLPLIYLGGVFYSLDVLPAFWQKVAMFNPLVYFISGIRWSFLGESDLSLQTCFLVSLGFLAMAAMLAWRGVLKGSYFRF